MLEMVKNPAELGRSYIDRIDNAKLENFNKSTEEDRILAELDSISEKCRFINQKYFVSVNIAFSIPCSFSADSQVSYTQFEPLSFEAKFVTYSIVKIGRILASHAVRALCVSFDESILLPYFDSLPEDHLLHVPVLAVGDMLATS